MVTKKFQIFGQVQGVGFRFSMLSEAGRQKLKGYVKNCSDGSVEAVVQGPEDQIQALKKWTEAGPGISTVDRVEVSDTTGSFNAFEIRS